MKQIKKATTKKTIEKLPEYYHQWKADQKFPDLQNALGNYTVEKELCTSYKDQIDKKIHRSYFLMKGIYLINKEICDLQNDYFTKEQEEAFCRAECTFGDGAYTLSENYEPVTETLNSMQIQLCVEVAELKLKLDVSLKEKDVLWAKYRALSDKYEQKFDDLKRKEAINNE
tara:strand:- start:182 stop:694 length:513 start_codon:yes stop_codon:yes gene_type:complete